MVLSVSIWYLIGHNIHTKLSLHERGISLNLQKDLNVRYLPLSLEFCRNRILASYCFVYVLACSNVIKYHLCRNAVNSKITDTKVRKKVQFSSLVYAPCQVRRELDVIFRVFFGSFGLSTKEPYTIMLCPLSLASLSLVSSVHTSPSTGLDIETSYFVYICTNVAHICTSNI